MAHVLQHPVLVPKSAFLTATPRLAHPFTLTRMVTVKTRQQQRRGETETRPQWRRECKTARPLQRAAASKEETRSHPAGRVCGGYLSV